MWSEPEQSSGVSDGERPWTVSELNDAVRTILEGSFRPFWLTGEVGSYNPYRSGHVYLTLKDAASQVRAVFFSGSEVCRRLGLKVGDQVEVFGSLSLYTQRGDYQFYIRKLQLCGVGDLHRQFAILKEKLAAEGIFDPAHKKPIPFLPRRIGVISSPMGAAVKDFMKIALARFPNLEIRLCPAPVQGKGAAEKLARAVRFFNRAGGVDVIVLTRGGGSMEDLWPFNEEVLARAIYASKIPVVSAVGHEIDFTISDFAADMRAPTPSGAAEQLVPEKRVLLDALDAMRQRMNTAASYAVERSAGRLAHVMGSKVFRDSMRLALERMQRVDMLMQSASAALTRRADAATHRLERVRAEFDAYDPFRILKRGYVYLAEPGTGRQITGVGGLRAGQCVRAILADGAADLDVRSVREAEAAGNGRRDLLPLITAKPDDINHEPNGERSVP
ncbi:MAG: exodeoxyribonuclease VII large subunit [Lentisphaeria bacterium]|nr:exodeoxyribonuclease VII large subunit [Lentisphaeria bacterium]